MRFDPIKVLTEELSRHPDIRIEGSAVDLFVARDKIVTLSPEVLALEDIADTVIEHLQQARQAA